MFNQDECIVLVVDVVIILFFTYIAKIFLYCQRYLCGVRQ